MTCSHGLFYRPVTSLHQLTTANSRMTRHSTTAGGQCLDIGWMPHAPGSAVAVVATHSRCSHCICRGCNKGCRSLLHTPAVMTDGSSSNGLALLLSLWLEHATDITGSLQTKQCAAALIELLKLRNHPTLAGWYCQL